MKAFADIAVKPAAQLNTSREVLLVLPSAKKTPINNEVISTEELH